jgi:hypothetical protein
MGQVVDDETGAPIKAFSLVLSPTPQLRRVSRQHVQRFFDDNGRFEFYATTTPGLARVTYLFAIVPHCAGGSARIQLVPEDQPRARPLTRLEGVVLRVHRGGTIVGQIVDSSGRGISQVRVELLPDSKAPAGSGQRAEFEMTLRRRFAQVTTVAESKRDGRFEMTGVMTGEWRLRVHHDLFASALHGDRITMMNATDTIDAGRIVMGRGGRVWGRVRDANHKPDEGAMVHLAPVPGGPGSPMQHRTDLTGTFDFRGLRPGVYYLSVTERKGVSTYRTLLTAGADPATATAPGIKIQVDEGSSIEQDL